MKILAIGAHPDDIEAGCAGTLAKYVQSGHEGPSARHDGRRHGGRKRNQEKRADAVDEDPQAM